MPEVIKIYKLTDGEKGKIRDIVHVVVDKRLNPSEYDDEDDFDDVVQQWEVDHLAQCIDEFIAEAVRMALVDLNFISHCFCQASI